MNRWLNLIDSAVMASLFAACVGRSLFQLSGGTWDWPVCVDANVWLYLGTMLARKFVRRTA
jgi:hypothetical protein